MELFELFYSLAIIIICVKIAGDFAVRLGQPSVLGKLIIGVIIGPAVLGLVHDTEVLESFSHLGVLFLMFIAGLETDLAELNKNIKSSLAVAVGGIVMPMLLGYLGGIGFGMNTNHAIFLGLLLSATSVSISVQTFRELGKLRSKEATTVIGAAIIDDVLVVVLLAVVMSFISTANESLTLVIGKKLLFFIVLAFLSWKVVPFLMNRLKSLKITEPVASVSIVICLAFAALAEYLGVAGIIGSFFAGVAIAQTEHEHIVLKKLEPIAYTIFVPVFFASIGLLVDFEGFLSGLGFIVVVSVLAIISKLFGAGLGARLTGFNNYSSLIVGSGMISRGEVALIIATLGLSKNLLDPEHFTELIIVVIITTIVTPPMLKYLLTNRK